MTLRLRLLGKGFFSVLVLFVLGRPIAYSQTSPVDSQRYLALMLLNLTAEETPQEIALINLSKQYGLNSLYLTIPWDKVYANSPSDTPNWKRFDEQIRLATSLGMKVAIRIHLGRNIANLKGFWDHSESQISNTGQPLLAGYRDTFFSFDNQPLVNKALAFVKEVTTRYKYLQTEKNLLFISVTNTNTQEGEYPGALIVNDKEETAVYDYSSTMTKGFQVWLKANYKKIERLNFLWGTYYKTFEEIPMPSNRWEPHQSFRQRYGKDLYIYRHLVLEKYMNQMIETIKSVDSGIRFVHDFGSVFDLGAGIRGTMGYKSLSKKADGIKINDDNSYDHRWSVDILRGDAPAGFITANEVFISSFIDNATYTRHLNENFEHGANFVSVVASTVAQLERVTPFLRQSAAYWLNKPIPQITYKEEVHYKLSDAVEKGGAHGVVYGEWAKKAYASPGSPQPVRVVLEEDLLEDSYWDDASNYAPYVFRPVPMQIIAVNKDFVYKLPTDTFSDYDGTIVRMDVGTLPDWLKYEAGVLRGRPAALGDFRILIKGVDDEGASSEAYFTIRVDTRENANKPPTVNSNFANQTIAIDKAFTYTIPKDAFIDADGSVTKVEVSELPAWLKFANGVLSGTPPALGEFRIIVKAYDDLNAFVETYFTIRVVEPQFLNRPPYVANALPVKYAAINHPFSYTIPNDIFGDSDGYISSITIQNRPSWVNLSLNTISGTPTEEGENRLIIRAYDNGGAYVEIPFVVMVEIPRLRFELVRGGSAVNQEIIRPLQQDDILEQRTLPALVNIFAYGNFDYDKVVFKLRGPLNISTSTSRFPYALFENEGGFTPFPGRYTLTVTAMEKDSSVITNSFQFSISYGNEFDISRDIEDWAFYPNPIETVLNVKLPAVLPGAEIDYFLITSSGKKMPISSGFITNSDHLAHIDLTGMAAGIYFIRLESKGEFLQQFRIFKK